MGAATTPARGEVPEALARLRAMFDARALGPADLDGAFWLELVADPPASMAPGEHYELLAYDALVRVRPEWACICLRAAAESYSGDKRSRDEAAATARADQVRAECFPSYASEGERLAEVAAWARARAAEWFRLADEGAASALRGEVAGSGDGGSLASGAVALRLRWLFRQQASVDQGLELPLDRLASALRLESRDRLLLIFLAATARDALFQTMVRSRTGGDASAALLAALLADEDAAEAPLLARFDVRAPLVGFALIRLVPPPGSEDSALRDCAVHLDDSVLAAAERRDHWPPLLADVARPLHAASEAELQLHRGTTAAIRAAAHLTGATSLVLRSTSVRSSRIAARAFASAIGRPLVDLRAAALRPTQLAPTLRALSREMRLRGAVLFVDLADSSDPQARGELIVELDRLGAGGGGPVAFHAPPEGDDALLRSLEDPVEISLFCPNTQARRACWELALEALELPRVAGAPELLAHPLDPAAIAHVVALVATQAKLTTPSSRRPSVSAAALLAMAHRLYPEPAGT